MNETENGMKMEEQRFDRLQEQIRTQERQIEAQKETIMDLQGTIELLESQNHSLNETVDTITNAFFWKASAPARAALDQVKWVMRPHTKKHLIRKGLHSLRVYGVRVTWRICFGGKYSQVAKQKLFTDRELAEQKAHHFPRKIKFSIVVPLYNTPKRFLCEMIDSVIAQTYSDWELCMADGSDAEHPDVELICRKYAAGDSRIRYQKLDKNLGISGNTNACLKMAEGDYIALFDHDDLLHPAALHEVMRAICEQDADFIYTDEATFKSPNVHKIISAHFKPDFAIDNLRANNYICHLSVFKRSLLEKAGGFREEYDGSQDHDLLLRLTSEAKTIAHIPMVLYYWRSHPQSVAQNIGAKLYAVNAGKNAVRDSVEQSGYHAAVESSRAFPTIYRLKYALTEEPLVSILIPTKNHLDTLKKCLDSIFQKTTYPNYEIILVDNGSDEKEVFSYYDELALSHPEVKVCHLDIPFNYSRLNNFAAEQAAGKYYILLNNDVEVITPEWVEEMLMYAQREDVGAVGCMLYYPNNKIQHAGIILGMGPDRAAGHAFLEVPKDEIGYMGRLCYAQDMSAVTAACMMVKASLYSAVGGFDESFLVAFNDVDFCLKIQRTGHLIVWTPYAELYHDESKSRGYEDSPEKQARFQTELKQFRQRWKKELEAGDPYYSPNLSLDRPDFFPEYVLFQHDARCHHIERPADCNHSEQAQVSTE